MKKALCFILALFVAALIGSTLGGGFMATPAEAAGAVPDEIKIGLVASISGGQALDGKNMVDAITLVKKELDAVGGLDIGGKKVKITWVIEDCEAKPEISVNAVQKLIEQDGVLAIVGPNNSGDTIASGEVSQAAQIPQITNTGTNIKVTQVGDYIFRACFIDPFQGKVIAKFAYDNLGVRKVAVLYDNADTYSSGLTDSFIEAFKNLGGKVVAAEAFSGQEIKDFSAQLTLIKNANPEAVFFPSHIENIPLQLQQARGMGITATLLGCDSWDYAALPDLVGRDVLEGAYYVTGFSPDAEGAKDFVKAFTDLAGYRPSFCSAMAYEAAHIVLNALQTAKTLDGPGIRDAMMKTDMTLPSGHVKFDEDRNPVKSGTILQVKDGVARFVDSISLN
ncbi:MAG: ABC transporter substrate-binding protein [Synergistaceae bacterium]|jgi:branched-chain amino acid transport system substrate-binding protein|nr:ABC transporter substrate-binding protein [Synergistaceae bacterium]